MNPSQYVSVGAGTSLLAEVLMYLTHWPLQPLTEPQAAAFAGLLVLLFGSCHGIVNAFLKKEGIDPPATPPVEPPHAA